ncbi:MAG: pyridoxal-phosphate dependent enzyme, partial [Anaerolineales bacterium]|nr:pyridoxal-phosphate dependent enzyme [Anaerolineales bacterium]
MPDKVSQEKQNAMKAYGAEIIITPTNAAPDSPEHYVSVAKRIAAETPNSFCIDQYDNPKNPMAHYKSTGPEIWEQTGGKIDYFVASASTGGTISGVGKYLKEQDATIKIVMPDPIGSIYFDYFKKGTTTETKGCTYLVEGIGEDFLPSAMDITVVDAIERAGDRESFLWARQLVRQEGIFAGGSSGSAIAGAIRYCRKLPAGRIPVVILPDSGSRYLSKFYDDKWMREFGFLSMEFGETLLGDLLLAKPNKMLHTAALGDSIRKVVTVMHQHGVSQMPVVGADGTLVGLIEEVDLLNHMLEKHEHNNDEKIDLLVQNAGAVFPPETPLENTMPSLTAGYALIVVENSKPVGILTKIDVLDYVAGKI